MKDILFLAHRIPFPPNKGDKIRSYNLLKFLSRSYRVHLGAFVDDPSDWRYRQEVEQLCGEICLLPLNPLQAKFKSLTAFLTGAPLTLPYFSDGQMQYWIDRLVERLPISAILVFSSAMAQYVEKYSEIMRIIDFVDVDSDKWRQYAEKKIWPTSWVYKREAECLFNFERHVANTFDHALFVTEHEVSLFTGMAPETSARVMVMQNGVDTGYFSGSEGYLNPYSTGRDVIVFTGAMDYWANIDAVVWFAEKIFPEIYRCHRSAQFAIVGARPTEAVLSLGRRDGIVVTGAVDDIRPYLAHARLAATPLRIARGVQNKVLEAMAMEKSVLSGSAAMEGIMVSPSLDVRIAEEVDEWVQQALGILEQNWLPVKSTKNRDFVMQRYSWDRNLGCIKTLLESL
jgi:sugar transferase (PEP-CTERM/EpsH1 system associated)